MGSDPRNPWLQYGSRPEPAPSVPQRPTAGGNPWAQYASPGAITAEPEEQFDRPRRPEPREPEGPGIFARVWDRINQRPEVSPHERRRALQDFRLKTHKAGTREVADAGGVAVMPEAAPLAPPPERGEPHRDFRPQSTRPPLAAVLEEETDTRSDTRRLQDEMRLAGRDRPEGPSGSGGTLEERRDQVAAERAEDRRRASEPVPNRNPFQEFGTGFGGAARGFTRVAVGEGLEALGAEERGEAISERGKEILDARQPRVAKVEDIRSVDDAVDWLSYSLGQGIGSTLGPLVAGAAGTAAGGPVGGVAAAGAVSYGLMHGEMRQALEEEGVAGPQLDKWAAGMAVPAAALEMLMPARLGRKLTAPARKKVARGLARRILREGGKSGGLESVTEMGQTALEKLAATGAAGAEFWTPENISEILNSGAAAFPTGFTFGGAGAPLTTRAAPDAQPEATPEAAAPENPWAAHAEAGPETGNEPPVEGVTESNVEAPPAAAGRRERTVFPGDGSKVETEYVLVDVDELVPSHDPFTFERQPEERFPAEIQGRAYHGERGRAAREDVIQKTNQYDVDLALDETSSADGGVSVVTPEGVAVAGNQRIMMLQRLQRERPEVYDQYLEQLRERADRFGVDPDQVQPGKVLVRRIVDEEVDTSDLDTLRRLNAASDAPRGKTKDVLSEAATKADQFRGAGRALRHFENTVGEDQTIRAYLETAGGRDFLTELVRDGVFTEGERARYVDATTGTPTDEGKLVIERIMRSAAIGDPDVVGRAPASTLRKLDSALPAIVQANQVEGWDVSPVLQEALDVLASARANGNTVEDQLGQGDLLGSGVSEEAAALARFLDGAKKSDVTEAFRGYAEDAASFRRQSQSEDMFGHEPTTAEESRGGRFGRAEVAALEPDAGTPAESFRRRFGAAAGGRFPRRQSSGTPSSRSLASEAGGAESTTDRSPPRFQSRSAPDQTSDQTLSPSVMALSTSPPSETGPSYSSGDLRVGAIDPSSGRKILHAYGDFKNILERAEALIEPYMEALNRAAAAVPGASKFNGARVKGMERIQEKIDAGHQPYTMGDYLGGRVLLDRVEDSDAVLEHLEGEGWTIIAGEDESFFHGDSRGGYRARHVQLLSPDGDIAVELQMAPREIQDVQEEAHAYYDIVRGSVEASLEEVQEAQRKVREIFDGAWARYIERTGADPRTGRSPDRGDGDTQALEPDRDLFGDPVAPEGPAQGDLLGEQPARSLTAAEQKAKQTVSLLAGKVQRGHASKAEREMYEQARSLLRRNDKLDAEEVARQAREAEEQRPVDRDTGDLFDTHPLEPGWSEAQLASERLPDSGRFASRATAVQEADAGQFSERGSDEAVPSRAQIQKDLEEALEIPVKTGGLGRRFKRAFGIYKSRPESIHLGTHGDIVTLAHELGHHVQKLFFGSPDGRIYDDHLVMLPQEVQEELLDLGEGISGGGLREGWAEFWRRYIDNPEVLPDRAPELTGYIQERLDTEFPRIRDVLEKGARDWRLHREGSELARVQSQISVGEPDPPTSMSEGWTRIRTAVLDKFEPIHQAVEQLSNGRPVEGEDAEMLARLAGGSSGIAEHFLEKGQISFAGKEVGPSLRSILEPVIGNLENFRAYAVSRRAQELHGRNIESGIRKEDANATVRQLEDHFGESFKPTFDALVEYQDNLLRYLVDAGVMSQRTYTAIKAKNRAYIPMMRVMDQQGATSGGASGFGHLFSPVKKIQGSGRQIVDPLESIVKATYEYAQLGAKQEVSQALARLAERQGAASQLEAVETPIRRIQFKLGEIEDQLAQVVGKETLDEIREMAAQDFKEATAGMDEAEIRARKLTPYDPAQELLGIFRPGDLFNKPNVISVLENGERRYYEVNPELFEALQGLDVEHAPLVARWLGIPARTLRAGATLAPEFQLRNPIRDQTMAAIQSEYGYTPYVDLFKGVLHILRKDETFWKWMASGGSRSSLLALDRKAMGRSVEELTRSGGVENVIKTQADALRLFGQATAELTTLNLRKAAETSLEGVQKALDPLARLSSLMEDATRVGEFANALEVEGDTKIGRQKAGAASREISIDFARHGAKTAALRVMSAFWNARLQGYDRLARAIKHDPAKFAGKAFVYITLPSLIELAVNWDDEEYWEQPQWQRDLFWMFKVGGTWYRIPKPFELGLVFGTLPQRIAEAAFRDDPTGVDKFLRETAPKELEGFIPAPTAIMPLVENVVNYSFFLDRPIVPRGEQDVAPRFQTGDYTSEAAKMVGRWTGTSPRKIDNLLHAYTGGLGRLGTQAIDRGAEAAGLRTPTESRGVAGVPGVRGITAREPGFSSESIERFYSRRGEAQEALQTKRFLDRENRHDELDEFMADPENRQKIRQVHVPGPAKGRYERASERLNTLRSRAERIRRDPELSRTEKKEQIDELGREARDVARRALEP